jgi:hypothetical protein
VVAQPASEARGFAPADKPRVAIASDGTLAAIHEPTRIAIIEVPGCAAFAEIGIDSEASASEIAWVGAPPRLIVLSRYTAHSTVHLLDPYGPRTIAEIRLEAPMKLYASVGSHALVVGGLGAAVLTATDSHLTPYQFPARSVPVTAGAAGSQFVAALGSSVEEWDPHSRMPKRRLKLPRTVVITAVGGSDRVVWMTTQSDPTRIDVMPLVNRGQPKSHTLPEPIAHVASHPRSDLLACIGAETGKLYIVDLDGRNGLRTIAVDGIERADAAGVALGRMTGVLVAQAGRPVAIIALDGREVEATAPAVSVREVEPPAPSLPSSLIGDPEDDRVREVPTTVQLSSPPLGPSAAPAVATVPRSSMAGRGAVSTPDGPSLSERFSAWRDRMRNARPRSAEPEALAWIDPRPSWRDDVVAWARAVVAGSVDRDPPAASPIDAVVTRFELSPPLSPALVLLYGAHLGGDAGVAPVDVAHVLGRRWDEALGRGQLAVRGVATYEDSRVRMVPAIARALDELPPRTGTLVGVAGTVALLGPCSVIAPDGPLGPVAEACLSSVGGAILAGHPDADPHELFVEARVYGAAPMTRITPATLDRIPADVPAILVATDEAMADQLGVPRLR